MAKAELGTKRRCLSCAAPFFDLDRTPIVCPKCGAAFQIIEYARSRPKWTPSAPFKKPGVAEPAASNVVEPELVDAEEEEDAAPATDDDEVEDDDREIDEDLEGEHDGVADV